MIPHCRGCTPSISTEPANAKIIAARRDTLPPVAAAPQQPLDVLGAVVVLPCRSIGLLPLRPRHAGVVGDDMLGIVAVHVGVHLHLALPQLLVMLRSGKRREAEELED